MTVNRRAQLTKSDLVRRIAERIGCEPPPMSTGSTEPRRIFELVVSELGLPIEPGNLTKPELAEAICRTADVDWDERTCESSGGTVTKIGLERVATSINRLLGSE